MNAATIMQTTDWSRFSVEDWFRQFGAWMNGDTERVTHIVKAIPVKKLSEKEREALLANYLSDENIKDRLRVDRRGVRCQINDNEARAIQRIIIELRSIENEIVNDWVDALWCHYVMGNSLREIADRKETSVLQIRQDMKCGVAFIVGRYANFIN